MISKSTLRNAMRIVPGAETVTYTPKHPEGLSLTISGVRFRPTADAAEFAAQGITIEVGSGLAIVPSDALTEAGLVPKMADLITAGSSSDWAGDWMVSGVIGGPLLAEYRLAVNKARRID